MCQSLMKSPVPLRSLAAIKMLRKLVLGAPLFSSKLPSYRAFSTSPKKRADFKDCHDYIDWVRAI